MNHAAAGARPLPIILDVEASGFGRGSYPIEIGLAFPDGSTESFLIHPAPGWSHWDPEAERVHGISRETLLVHGRNVVEVAALLNARLAGNRAYSDAWNFDSSWVARLFDTAGFPQHFRLDTVRTLLDETEVEAWAEAKRRVRSEHGEVVHRAGADARLLQLTVREAWCLAAGGTDDGASV
jgi:DNA polymerase III, epsilon subunit and related 3''-5'' exonucleases